MIVRLLLIMILSSATATSIFAQASATSINVPAISMIGGEWTNKKSYGGRLYTGFGPDFLIFSPVTLAFTRDAGDKKVKMSMNPLFTAASLPSVLAIHSSRNWALFGLFALPQVLGNMTVQIPIIRRHAYLNIAQRTDYYLFNDVARIYTEGSLGLRVYVDPIGAEVRYVWPITKGFLEGKGPYFSVSLYLVNVNTTGRSDDQLLEFEE